MVGFCQVPSVPAAQIINQLTDDMCLLIADYDIVVNLCHLNFYCFM